MGAPSPSPDESGIVAIGSLLDGRYRVDAILGVGGMGRVYKAEHTLSRKKLAIKILHPHLSVFGNQLRRFVREAYAANQVGHSGAVAVYDDNLEGADAFLVMELLDGKNLSDSFEVTALFPPLVLRMIRVGESTGALEESLENVAYFYTRDVRESIQRLQAMIEPAMTVILGAIVGWVMFSVLGPIYDLITTIEF